MPIEIKELHIKINVNEGSDSSSSADTAPNQKQEIIAACVEQVMEIISKNQER